MKKVTDPNVLARLNESVAAEPPAPSDAGTPVSPPTGSPLAPQTDVPVVPISGGAVPPVSAQSSEAMPTRVTDPFTLATLNEEPQTVEGWLDDPINASRAILDGIWFGWSDEIGAGIAAAAVKAFGAPGSEKSFTDIRKEMLGQLELERADYATENPTASTLLTLTGALASPLNYLLPGAASLTTAKAASSAVPFVANAGRALETLGATKGITPQLAKGLGLGVTEGAVAGAGTATEGSKVEGALSGAAWGAALPLGIAGVRGTAATVGKRRITQSLGEGADFIPIPLAGAEERGRYGSLMTSFYKGVVGKAFGGASLISQQVKRWSEPVKEAIEVGKLEIGELTQKSKEVLNQAKTRLKADQASLKDEIASLKAKTPTVPKGAKREITEEVNKAKAMELDAYVNALESAFRAKAVRASVPKGLPKKAAAELEKELSEAATMQQINNILDRTWAKYGFSMLEGRSFRINPEAIAARMEEELGGEWLLAAQLVGSKATRASEFIATYLDTYTRKGGYISGSDLSRLRSRIGTLANDMSGASGASGAEKQVLKRLQEILNDTVEGQLGKEAKAAFEQHRDAWKYYSTLKDATLVASATAGQRGAFTSEQWLTATLRNRQTLGRRGEAVFQKEADDIADLVKARDAHLEERANFEIVSRMERLNAEAQRGIDDIQGRLAELEQRKKALALQKAEDSPEYRVALEDIKRAEESLTLLEKRKAALKELTPSKNPSIFEKLAATTFLGSFLTPIAGAAVIPVGMTVARVLASESGQRFLAGQTRAQEALVRGVKATTGAESSIATRAISRTTGRQNDESLSTFTSAEIRALGTGSTGAKADAYYRLQKAGKLEEVRRKNPRVYADLKAAYEALVTPTQ